MKLQMQALYNYKGHRNLSFSGKCGDFYLTLFLRMTPSIWMTSILPGLFLVSTMAVGKLNRTVINVEVVTIGLIYPGTGASLVYHGVTINEAIKQLRQKYSGVFNITHSYLVDKKVVNCTQLVYHADFMLAEWYYKQKISADLYAMVSPSYAQVDKIDYFPNSGSCGTESLPPLLFNLACIEETNMNRLAAGWNMLMVTSLAADPVLRNKTISPTRIGFTVITNSDFSLLFYNVFEFYSWTSLYYVIDDDAIAIYPVTARAIIALMKNISDVQQYDIKIKSRTFSAEDYNKVLLEFQKYSRVMIFLGTAQGLRKLMIQAALHNMTNGEYVYMGMEYYKSFGIFTWQQNDQFDDVAREAFRSVLIFGLDDANSSGPPEDQFQNWQLQTYMIYNYMLNSSNVPWSALAATKVAFYVFGNVLNNTLTTEPHFDLVNGKELAKRFWNRTFTVDDETIYIDESGERRNTIFVKDLDRETGLFKEVLYQDARTHVIHLVSKETIDWGGADGSQAPPNMPTCGYRGERCLTPETIQTIYGTGFSVVTCCVCIAAVGGFVWIRRWAAKSGVSDRSWHLDVENLFLGHVDHATGGHTKSYRAFLDAQETQSRTGNLAITHGHGTYLSAQVWVQSIDVVNANGLVKLLSITKVLDEIHHLLQRIRAVSHSNINAFVGACILLDHRRLLLITAYCQRGSLCDFQRNSVLFNIENSASLAFDFIEGLKFIHSSSFRFHGDLTGWSCLINSRFTLKISKLGQSALRQQLINHDLIQTQLGENHDKLLWTAPEVLRGDNPATTLADIYSAGILLYEILTGKPAYYAKTTMTSKEIIYRIRYGESPAFRPNIEDTTVAVPAPFNLCPVLTSCWNEDVECRPNIEQVHHAFTRMFVAENGAKRNIEKLLTRMDMYASSLEDEVERRQKYLIAETMKCEALLHEILPKAVVARLKRGQPVDAESFESVTITFTDLYGFTELAATKTPFELTALLNLLYSAFDPTLEPFDVYKVETIGSVYMVASGVPQRNGVKHVKEICSLVLSLQEVFIKLSTTNGLYFRAGIHTGPCAAGVMGQKNPRYCLFGDTINTASRMGSHCLPDKIHVSLPTAQLLIAHFPSFNVRERGIIDIKGKGQHMTYWLE